MNRLAINKEDIAIVSVHLPGLFQRRGVGNKKS